MKKNTKKILSAALALVMIASSVPTVFAEGEASSSTQPSSAPSQLENLAEGQSVASADRDKALVEMSNSLANGTHTYYNTARDTITVENKTMKLNYGLKGFSNKMYVQSLSNSKGVNYITDTMDVFVKDASGNTHYASKSITDAEANIYRYGYYYYENRIEGQVFTTDITADPNYNFSVDLTNPYKTNHISYNKSGKYFTVNADASDPFIGFVTGTKKSSFIITTYNYLKAADYDTVEIKVKAENATSGAQIFIVAGSETGFNSTQSKNFTFETDGEWHTYRINISDIAGYTGELKYVRFDIPAAPGSRVDIEYIKVYKAQQVGISSALSMQRSFLSYSDKLHHVAQFSTTEEITDIDSVGMTTKIDANTVNALIVKDASGYKTSLDGVDWASAEYVGFDIAGAGIFGYILPADNNSGSMTVTLENGYYVITQTLPVSKFTPSEKGNRNSNDIFFGQRIYNDETHSFDDFIVAAECERHPLTDENVIVYASDSTGGSFKGYDALYGHYVFGISGTGFNPAYYDFPNRHFNVSFTVKGDQYDRQMYFVTRCTSTGGLEGAALLNADSMLLPVPVQVSKNFAGDGENTIYNLDDAAYSEAYFPMTVKADETVSYNILNLYQNWGQYPLKQISSIQYHTPYYHLSTGVTETNCITLFSPCGPGLPDHRGMSAPFWTGQPQHNSAGGHSFLRYYDENGKYITSQNSSAVIDSYGLAYCDIIYGVESSDGKISATYTHTEMPQTDENRTFYELKYTFNEDITFKDFAEDFIFYRVTDNNGKGVYKKVGYLDANNQSQVVDAISTAGERQDFVLGDACPYFSFFMMPDWDREASWIHGYTNLAMLFKDWTVISGGEEIETNLYLINTKDYLTLTMNLGEITFKAGDTITINAILMPWGSDQMEDDPANRLENAQTANYNSPHYSDVLPDGTLYMDKNVRDVRENTLLNPMTATAVENCQVIESAFVPKVKTTNGKYTTFTVSGGSNNVAIRAYGFDMLTVPKIEQLVDGKWIEYTVSSINTPDKYGFGYYYDGYTVHYDDDGTYSYSFVTDMTGVESKTFRVSADVAFDGWPAEEAAEGASAMNVYWSASDICLLSASSSFYGVETLSDDQSYTSLYGNGSSAEAYLNVFSNTDNIVTGKYVVYKYRIPTDNTTEIKDMDVWVSTVNSGATGDGYSNDCISISGNALVRDGKWHVMVIDVPTIKSGFKPEADGTYHAKYLRVDTWNTKLDTASYIDVAYIAMSDSLDEILLANSDVETIDFITSNNTYTSKSTSVTVPESAPTLSISAQTVPNNTQFTVAVDLSQNSGLSYLRLAPLYDREEFTLVDVTNGEAMGNLDAGKAYVTWSNTSNSTSDGNLIYFTFAPKSDYVYGTFEFGVKVLDANNTAGQEVTFNTIFGQVTVLDDGVIHGDANGDGKVGLEDLILLRKYLADIDDETGATDIEVSNGADANRDRKIDSADVFLIRRYLANYNYDTGTSSTPIGKQ